MEKIADSISSKLLVAVTWNTIFVLLRSFDSSIGKATGYRLGRSYIFFFSIASKLPLELARPPVLLVPGALSSRIKRSRLEVYQSPPYFAEIKNFGAIPALFTCPCSMVLN